MDQIKIGGFIKELRKEKGLTQEQLAEQQQEIGSPLWRPLPQSLSPAKRTPKFRQNICNIAKNS